MSEVLAFLSTVEDLREQEKIIYPLSSLLFMSICAIFCGAGSWDLLNHEQTGCQNILICRLEYHITAPSDVSSQLLSPVHGVL